MNALALAILWSDLQADLPLTKPATEVARHCPFSRAFVDPIGGCYGVTMPREACRP
jgi:hypothetical protein